MKFSSADINRTDHQKSDGVASEGRLAYEAPRLERHDNWEIVTGQEGSLPAGPDFFDGYTD